jgi:tellurite resistance protein TerC
MGIQTVGSPLLWVGFIVFVLAMLALDLGVFNRKAHEVSLKEAGLWSCVWVALAMVFNYGVYHWFGAERALEFTTGYLLEKALSVDNLFVFLVLFSYFRVPGVYQQRVLLWGILGALLMRALFIGAGTALIVRFHWIMYIFGGFLVLTGLKLLRSGEDEEMHPEKNPVVRVFKRLVPLTSDYREHHFFVRESGRLFATPLLLVLVTIEATDVIFALDSIPAIFAVTQDPFIVFTSNIFAILGLRALYFLLHGLMSRFKYLKVGLALVLCFIGVKMLIVDIYKIPIQLSLVLIAAILGLSVGISLLKTAPEEGGEKPKDPSGAEAGE